MHEPLSQSTRRHILTIAFEDYFHGPAFANIINRTKWNRFETRFEQNGLAVLQKLDEAKSQATFFANSWIARNYPDLLQEVVRRGHEVALAGQRNCSFRFLTREALREQLRRERDVLEQASGKQVLGFRVSDVLLRPSDLWALEVLCEEGFLFDSSVSPFLRAFAAEPKWQFLHRQEYAGGSLWEVPLSSKKLAGGIMLPIAGGNYFRQFPEWLVNSVLDAWNSRCEHPLVLYFRLWDFDPIQPKLQTGSMWRNLRHYRNGERMVGTLAQIFARFQFTSVANYLGLQAPARQICSEPDTSISTYVHPETRLRSAPKPEPVPISVIVPCFNEEVGISYLNRTLNELKAELAEDYSIQFVLVDDGSTDATWQLLNQVFAGRTDTLLLRHPQNRGVSAAIMTGLAQAREIACSLDCDCSYDPLQLRPMLELMKGDVDLVTASPYHPRGSVLNVPQWRLGLSRVSSRLYRVVTGRKLHTFTACVRVYRRSSVSAVSLTYSGFLGIAELLSRLALTNKVIVEHPATLEVRIFGQSKLRVLRTVLGHLHLLSQLTRLRLRTRSQMRGERRDRLGPQTHAPSTILPKAES